MHFRDPDPLDCKDCITFAPNAYEAKQSCLDLYGTKIVYLNCENFTHYKQKALINVFRRLKLCKSRLCLHQ